MTDDEKMIDNKPEWDFDYDRYFTQFLSKNKLGLVICSYKSNKLFSLGTTFNSDSNMTILSFRMASINRVMSTCFDKKRNILHVGAQLCVSTFYNNGHSKSDFPYLTDFDTTFKEKSVNIVNDLDIHNICIDTNGKSYFCSPLFSCVCELSDTHSLKVFWQPPWISKIASEDRCHLNGVCCGSDGIPQYVTSVSRTDIISGWRECKTTGGCVYDIINNKLICKNLSMPHSPVWYNDKLWLLESGTGYFGYIDFSTTVTDKDEETYHPFIKQVFLPGFIRGLSFYEKYAVVGCSVDRHEKTFMGLELNTTMKDKKILAKCGIYIINIENMNISHNFTFNENTKNDIDEIYDVTIIPNCTRHDIITRDVIDPTDYTLEQ